MQKCPKCGSPVHRGKCVRWPVCTFKEQIFNELPEEFISFDLETTGLNKKSCRIIEIGAVKMRRTANGTYREVDCFSQLVNPGKTQTGTQIYISQKITGLTGITNEMVKDEPVESECVRRFIEWCGDNAVITGQNIAKFDIPFFKEASQRADTKWNFSNYIDTLTLAKDLRLKEQGYVDNLKQTTLAKWIGFTYNAHRAVDDCRANVKILLPLVKRAQDEKLPLFKTK
jgi:DNA polymerase-3 subunit alpha (Gram-positive type)